MEVGAHGFTYSVVAQDLYDPMDREQKWYSDAATAHILVNQQRVALCGAESGAPGCYAGYVWHYLTTDDPRPVCKRCIAALPFQHTGLAVVLQGLVRPRLRGTELEFWRNSEEARTDRPSQQLRSLNGEWRLMRYFLLTHLCGISHRIWCTLSTICSDAA